MTTIKETISRIRANMAKPDYRCKLVSDDVVARKIKAMSDEYGYEPSERDIEPIRTYLSGYGILLSGETGIGKTFLMRCLNCRLRRMDEIMEYGLRNLHNWYSWTDDTNLCLDDLGSEPVLSEYGTREDIMKQVIAHRSERQTGRTSVTTNFTADEIAARYGDRTLSRLLGMCKSFVLTGDNRRAALPVL